MATDERVQRLLVRLESDQQSATRTQADISRYLSSLEAVEQQQKSVDSAYNEARAVEQDLARAREQSERITRDGRDELARYNQEQREAQYTAGAASAATDDLARSERAATDALLEQETALERGNRLLAERQAARKAATEAEREFASAAQMTATVSATGAAGGGRAGLSQALGNIGGAIGGRLGGFGGELMSALATLNPAMIAAGVAGIGLAAALDHVQKGFEETRQAGEEFARRSQEISEQAASGATTADIEQQITRLEAARTGVQSYIDLLTSTKERIDNIRAAYADSNAEIRRLTDLLPGATNYEAVAQQIRDVQQSQETLRASEANALEQLRVISGGVITSYDSIGEAITKNEGYIADATQSIELYNNAIVAGMFAYNDATAAMDVFKANARDAFLGGLGFINDWAEGQREQRQLAAEEQADALRAEFAFRQQAAQLRESGTSAQLDSIYLLNEQEQTLNAERIRRLMPLADASESVAAEIEALTERQAELTMQNRILRESVEPIIKQREREAAAAQQQKTAVDDLMTATTAYVTAQEKAGEAFASYQEAISKHEDKLAQIALELAEREDTLRAQAARDVVEAESRAASERVKVVEDLQDRLLDIERQAARNYENASARRDVLGAIQAMQQAQDQREREQKNAQKRIDDLDDQLEEQAKVQKQRLDEQLRVARDAANKALRQEVERANAEIRLRGQAYQQSLVAVQNAEYARMSIQQYYYGLMIDAAYQAGAAQVQAYRAGAATMQYQNYPGTIPNAYTTTQPAQMGGSQQVTINVQGQTLRGVERQVFGVLRQIWAD